MLTIAAASGLYRSMKFLIALVISNVLILLYLTSIGMICLPFCKMKSTPFSSILPEPETMNLYGRFMYYMPFKNLPAFSLR